MRRDSNPTDVVTTQQATGSARGPYDKVSFHIRVEGRGNTGPQAKSHAQENVLTLRNTIAQLEKSGVVFLPTDNTAAFSVQQEHVYDPNTGRNMPHGYTAVFNMNLVTKQVDRAPEILDALTSEDGLTVDSPNFSVCSEKRLELQKEAIKQAWEMVRQRFEVECEILAQDPSDFEVGTWTAHYRDGGDTPVYAASLQTLGGAEMADAPDAGPLVQSGMATVNATLSVGFQRTLRSTRLFARESERSGPDGLAF